MGSMTPRLRPRSTVVLLTGALSVACGIPDFIDGLSRGEDTCGDGVWGPLEECDGSVPELAAWCSGFCTWGYCGDGVLQPDEICDPIDHLTCEVGCQPAGCESGRAAGGELCVEVVEPARIAGRGPIVGWELVDVEGDGDLDLLLATAVGVEVWLSESGALQRIFEDERPGLVGVGWLPRSDLPALVAVDADEAGSTTWLYEPSLLGWSEPAGIGSPWSDTTLHIRGLRQAGTLLVARSNVGPLWFDDRWVQFVATQYADLPIFVVPGNHEHPTVWEVDDREPRVKLRRYNFRNLNVPGLEDGVVALPEGFAPLGLLPMAPHGQPAAEVWAYDAEGRVVSVPEPMNGSEAGFGAAPDLGALRHAALGPIDGLNEPLGGAVGDPDLALVREEAVEIVFDGARVGAQWDWNNPKNVLAPPPIDEVAVRDVDGDGAADILTVHRESGEVRVWWSRP